MLTQEKLKELLHYDPLTGIFIRKVRTANRVKIGDVAGTINSKGYLQIGIEGKSYRAHRLAWLYVHGYFTEYGIDHKDRIKTHNQISNLREVSQQCNLRNCGIRITNISGMRGVLWNKKTNKFQAQIAINYKQKYLGIYADFENAVCARLAGEQACNWSGCDSSSPAFQYVQKMLNQRNI